MGLLDKLTKTVEKAVKGPTEEELLAELEHKNISELEELYQFDKEKNMMSALGTKDMSQLMKFASAEKYPKALVKKALDKKKEEKSLSDAKENAEAKAKEAEAKASSEPCIECKFYNDNDFICKITDEKKKPKDHCEQWVVSDAAKEQKLAEIKAQAETQVKAYEEAQAEAEKKEKEGCALCSHYRSDNSACTLPIEKPKESSPFGDSKIGKIYGTTFNLGLKMMGGNKSEGTPVVKVAPDHICEKFVRNLTRICSNCSSFSSSDYCSYKGYYVKSAEHCIHFTEAKKDCTTCIFYQVKYNKPYCNSSHEKLDSIQTCNEYSKKK